MTQELRSVISQIQREKGIDPEKIIEAIISAVLAAARKRYGATANVQASVDPENGQIEAFCIMTVVEEVEDPILEILLEEAKKMDQDAEVGDQIGLPIDASEFGRIAAQTAKQVIFQQIREAEFEVVFREYSVRQGDLISGTVAGRDRRSYIVDLGKTEALLPYSEQVPSESYRRGDRVRCFLLEVKPAGRGPQLIVSRSHIDFVAKLFELEVPEIAEGVVEIRGVVREPGDRTKIAVVSKDPAVDPVGACVGVKGSRVQAVVRELRGEKIDIIAWTNEPRTFIGEALSPAVIDKVGLKEEERSALVVVADQMLSLAIGKKGQNVRLAAKLTGWKIDIMGETEYDGVRSGEREREIDQAISRTQKEQQAQEQQVQRVMGSLEVLGITEELIQKLKDQGLDNVEKISQVPLGILSSVSDMGEEAAGNLIQQAHEALKPVEEVEKSSEVAENMPKAADNLPGEAEKSVSEDMPEAEPQLTESCGFTGDLEADSPPLQEESTSGEDSKPVEEESRPIEKDGPEGS